MACGCNRRARAKAQGRVIAGYRVTMPDGTVVPAEDKPPFMSPGEAKAQIRGVGGTVNVEYRQAS